MSRKNTRMAEALRRVKATNQHNTDRWREFAELEFLEMYARQRLAALRSMVVAPEKEYIRQQQIEQYEQDLATYFRR